ncbi:MAG: cyclic pyranopterin monophosphate synthase MoaC [Spirochaetales bacterium]|nr:cyclic pyranopterin monophosphate synthase MoaC [Spirochaetales bacterium]
MEKKGDFSHVDSDGKACMVNVAAKPDSRRIALAEGYIFLQEETIALIRENSIKKGDVLSVARIAGISGGKKTSDFIPLCHNIFISALNVDFEIHEDKIRIVAEAECISKTGIEMEALAAVSIAALTIYDMCKAVDKKMVIGDIRLLKKEKFVL